MAELALGLGVHTPCFRQTARRLSVNTTIYALGDSRTTDNFRNGFPGCGYGSAMRELAAGRVCFEKPFNGGWSGETSADIYTNRFQAALDSGAAILVLLAGTNDAEQSVPLQDCLNALDRLIDDWLASDTGRVVVVADEAPAGPAYAANNGYRASIRDHIRSRANAAAGIYVWSLWNSMVHTLNGTDLRTGAYRDDLHWGGKGMWYAGASLWTALSQIVPQLDWDVLGGSLAGGAFTGTTLAENGWMAYNPDGVPVTVENGEIVVDFAAGYVNPTIALYPTSTAIPAGVTAGSSTLRQSMKFSVDAGVQNLGNVYFEARKQSNTALLTPGGDTAKDGQFVASTEFATVGPRLDGMNAHLFSPPMVFPADATQLRPFFVTIGGFPSQTTSGGKVRLSLPQLRDCAAPQLIT